MLFSTCYSWTQTSSPYPPRGARALTVHTPSPSVQPGRDACLSFFLLFFFFVFWIPVTGPLTQPKLLYFCALIEINAGDAKRNRLALVTENLTSGLGFFPLLPCRLLWPERNSQRRFRLDSQECWPMLWRWVDVGDFGMGQYSYDPLWEWTCLLDLISSPECPRYFSSLFLVFSIVLEMTSLWKYYHCLHHTLFHMNHSPVPLLRRYSQPDTSVMACVYFLRGGDRPLHSLAFGCKALKGQCQWPVVSGSGPCAGYWSGWQLQNHVPHSDGSSAGTQG